MAAAETSMLVAADKVQGATICNDTTGRQTGVDPLPSRCERLVAMMELIMTQFQASTLAVALVNFGFSSEVIADRPALFDVNKCTCIGDLCTCPDAKGVFFTKDQIDALKALPKPSKPLEVPDTTKE